MQLLRLSNRNCLLNYVFVKRRLERPISNSVSRIMLLVEPQSTLADVPVTLSLSGLNPEENITLHAHVEESGKRFGSYAHYVANAKGVIDLNTMASMGGTYEGVEPMGLLWSMNLEPNQRKGSRLLKKNVLTPMIINISTYQGHCTWNNIHDKNDLNTLATHSIERWYIDSKKVQRVQVRYGNIRGSLFLPQGDGPFGGVIDLYGSAGGLMEHRASLLASHGLATLALAYIGYEDLPSSRLSYLDLDLKYFEEAMNWLLGLPSIRAASIGIIGSSVGSDLAIQMACFFKEKISAVVAINPLYYHYSVPARYKGEKLLSPSIPSEFSHARKNNEGILTNFGTHVYPIYEPILEESLVKIEEAASNFLIIHSGDDRIVDPTSSFQLNQRLKRRTSGAEHETILYAGAGHLLEPPFLPHLPVVYWGVMDSLTLCGGVAHLHHRAQVDAWQKILAFLQKHLSKS